MAVLGEENFSELIANREDQTRILRARSKPHIERKVRKKEFNEPDDGWYVLDNTLKRDVKLAKKKLHDEILEDRVWCMLSRMGFKFISADRHCRVSYDSGGSAQQLDVLAVDDDCAIIVECKSAEGVAPKPAKLKTELESIAGKKPGLHREIKDLFQNKNLKIGYILVTNNYIVIEADKDRFDSFQIRHFDENDIEYYEELLNHLGSAARYQFEADIFNKQKIPNLDGRTYAVKGSMGGIDYYSFLIEPEKLLKLGYVLHRSKAIQLLPTYQRLIKKGRLRAIQKFVNNGGYFPNSLLVSIDKDGKKLNFEPSSPTIEGSQSKPGVLHLPNRYRSLYVIDGQHRLYGYSDTTFSENNVIPVVAFEDLDRKEQLRLFMEINENQKAVSKNLKHTLDADLKWDAENLRDRADGITKQLAQELGEESSSPLFKRVLVGEDIRTEIKVVTLDAIIRGVNLTPFIGKFTKDSVKEQGLLNTGDSKKTLKLTKDVINGCLSISQSLFPDEWERAPKELSLVNVNPGVTAFIALVGDIVKHMAERSEIKPLQSSSDMIVKASQAYLEGLAPFFSSLTETDRQEIRKKYGSGGHPRYRRIFQRAINEFRDDFEPDGLKEYWEDESKQFNVDTYARIADIEVLLREEVKDVLHETYGPMWLKKGLPAKLYTELHTRAIEKNRTIENQAHEKSPWDCLDLIHLREIVEYAGHWSNHFQKRLTIPGQEGLKKAEKTSWFVRLGKIRNIVDHEYSVSKEDADYVAALHDWLIIDDATAIRSLSD